MALFIISETLSFPSKKEAKIHIKNIIMSYKNGCIISDRTHHETLLSLQCLHHERPRDKSEIKCFVSQRALNGGPQLLVVLHSGITDCISWNTCITGHKNTPEQNMIAAMRTAIVPDTMAAKQGLENKCAGCGDINNLEIDHKNPIFIHIVKEFLEIYTEYGVAPEFYDEIPRTHQIVFQEKDAGLKNAWVSHHRSRATYQILCRPCNSKKGTKSV